MPMIAGGSVLISVATTGIIAGASLYTGAGQDQPFVCSNFGCTQAAPDSGARAGGVALMVIGLVAMGVGIPLVAIGAQKVPDRDEARVLVPSLHVGAGSASLLWSF
jgi:hypothetical protein